VAAVTELIESLPGVESARILLDEDGGIAEIHVLADIGRHPKAIVRDIESALFARWGLAVDRRRISVAQVGDPAPRPHWQRLRLQQVAMTTDPVRGWVEVSVSLVPGGARDAFGRPREGEAPARMWRGKASGGSAHMAIRLAAEATLEALNQAVLPRHRFAVADIERVRVGAHEVVVAVLHYHGPRGAASVVSGSAVVRHEAVEAAVRAVLDGTNRLFGIVSRPPLEAESTVEVAEPGPEAWGVRGEAAAGREAVEEGE
jgi:hypothetical protein